MAVLVWVTVTHALAEESQSVTIPAAFGSFSYFVNTYNKLKSPGSKVRSSKSHLIGSDPTVQQTRAPNWTDKQTPVKPRVAAAYC